MEQNDLYCKAELYRNSLTASPLLIGFFHPAVILTKTEISDTDFYYTVLHELMHYRRRDMFYKWLVQFTICLHWFNPFVYVLEREISRLCELFCDEAVVLDAFQKCKDHTWYVIADDDIQYIYYNDLPGQYAYEPKISGQKAKITIVDVRSFEGFEEAYVLLAVRKNVPLSIKYRDREVVLHKISV